MAARKGARPESWLGASRPLGTLIIVLFVPSKDRNGSDIDHDFWVTAALETLGKLFRGATAYPRARGVWRDDERGGDLRYEEPTIVTCYADPRALTDAARLQLRAFLHRLGRETNQGEVGIVIGSQYYGIAKYDSHPA
ncbi:MAG TPA: hypothetical protein VI636_06055 [Candidatus Angelobacter sp.]